MLNDIKKLEAGKQQEVQIVIKSAENATTRNGDRYQKLIVRDNNDHEAIFFNFKEEIVGKFPFVVNATVDTSEYRESACSKIISYQIDKSANVSDFLPAAKIDSDASIKILANKSRNLRMGLRKILASILNEHVKEFQYYPLNKAGCYSRTSGILEATIKLTEMAENAAESLGLDKDLMIAGAMLYYIGKTQTIDNSYNYTPDDVLLGTGLSATIIVHDTVDKLKKDEKISPLINEQDVKLLMHILSSRFKGIPTAIPEACALRYLDAIVTEIESMKTIQAEEENESIVTDRRGYNGRIYCPGVTSKTEPGSAAATENQK